MVIAFCIVTEPHHQLTINSYSAYTMNNGPRHKLSIQAHACHVLRTSHIDCYDISKISPSLFWQTNLQLFLQMGILWPNKIGNDTLNNDN